MSLKEFFYFPKSDRKGIILALCVAAAAFFGVYFVGKGNSVSSDDVTVSGEEMGSDSTMTQEGGYYATEEMKVKLTPFDPNVADSTQLLELGLKPWQVRSIYRYRAKGGVFSKPEDFAQVYGLTVKKYLELLPYIHISPEYREASEVYGRKAHKTNRSQRRWQHDEGERGIKESFSPDAPANVVSGGFSRDTVLYPVKLKVGEVIDLNTADTTKLKKVPGIGSYFAKKVVAYREKLGGFYSTDQLLEIEGFPEDVADFFSLDANMVRRMNVNKMSIGQMMKHPYISFSMAKAIADRRRLKGPLTSLDDLSLLPSFTPEAIEQLSHYVSF